MELKEVKKKIDRINLTEKSRLKLEKWMQQLEAKHPGIQISKSALVNWLLQDTPESLSVRTLKKLKEEFFDEERLAQWLLKELKDAKKRGTETSIKELLTNKAANQAALSSAGEDS